MANEGEREDEWTDKDWDQVHVGDLVRIEWGVGVDYPGIFKGRITAVGKNSFVARFEYPGNASEVISINPSTYRDLTNRVELISVEWRRPNGPAQSSAALGVTGG